MKTIIWSPCRLDGLDPFGFQRFDRTVKNIKWYLNIHSHLKFDEIHLAHDSEDNEAIQQLQNFIPTTTINHDMGPRLPRRGGDYDYPYGWRCMDGLRNHLFDGNEIDKVYIIESDAYIVSRRLAQYAERCRTGWTSLWCQRHHFPETAFSILCIDSFHLMLRDWVKECSGYCGETITPYTRILGPDMFKADRYGETNDPQRPEMDLYCQCGNPDLRFIE